MVIESLKIFPRKILYKVSKSTPRMSVFNDEDKSKNKYLEKI